MGKRGQSLIMMLLKDEAICLVLYFTEDNIITSNTKLNKLIASLNLFFIPINITFSLNKYGSFNPSLEKLRSNEYFSIESYDYKGKECHKYRLEPKGNILFETVIMKKLRQILTSGEIDTLKENIKALSQMSADDISAKEHEMLFLDVEDRFKLQQTLNATFVDLKELYDGIDKVGDDNIASLRLKALIEYSYYLIKFLREKKFKHLDESEYDFEANMYDYYLLHLVAKILPFLEKQKNSAEKNTLLINKYYQYLVHCTDKDYHFSLNNPELEALIYRKRH